MAMFVSCQSWNRNGALVTTGRALRPANHAHCWVIVRRGEDIYRKRRLRKTALGGERKVRLFDGEHGGPTSLGRTDLRAIHSRQLGSADALPAGRSTRLSL